MNVSSLLDDDNRGNEEDDGASQEFSGRTNPSHPGFGAGRHEMSRQTYSSPNLTRREASRVQQGRDLGSSVSKRPSGRNAFPASSSVRHNPIPAADDTLIARLRMVRNSLDTRQGVDGADRRVVAERNVSPLYQTKGNQTSAGPSGSSSRDRGRHLKNISEQNESPSSRSHEAPEARPFVCPECAKRFFKKDHLTKHWKAIHLKQRPFLCNSCGSRFAQRSDLNKHITAVHLRLQPHQCDICSQRFSHRGNLLRHYDGVHGTRGPYACKSCGRACDSEAALEKHLRSAHKKK